MGKKNPAQRTKGNAKSSSSARAAELLSTSGAPAYSFGFGGATASTVAGNPALSTGNDASSPSGAFIVPTAASVPFAAVATNLTAFDDGGDSSSAASQLSGDVKLLLKKMTKRDTITKCKALNEFIALLDDDAVEKQKQQQQQQQTRPEDDDAKSLNEATKADVNDNVDQPTENVDQSTDEVEDDEDVSTSPNRKKTFTTDDVKSLIPFWPRIYNALSMDSDRKVRELTQQAMLQLVKPERKKLLAPHIKTFLGAWMLALVDSYPPAASAASRAFDAAFSKAKQLDAVRFCRKEILFYLKDILLDQSPSTLSDPKATPKDEMDAKYERVVAASLSALKTLVEMVVCGGDDSGSVAVDAIDKDQATASSSASSSSKGRKKSDDDTSLDVELVTLLSNKKMVKLSVHSNPIIRAAWFSLVAAVCAKRPILLDPSATDGDYGGGVEVAGKLASHFASSVLNRFEETDPAVVSALWTAVMAVLKVVPDPWSHASVGKSVMPKLFSLLRAGCGGNSVIVCPHIVVLVSKMPADFVGIESGSPFTYFEADQSPGLCFYGELSSSVNEALDKGGKTFVQSPSESAALVLCLAECLQFLLASSSSGHAQNSSNAESNADDGDTVVADHSQRILAKRVPLVKELLTLLEISLRHKNSKQIFSPQFFRVFGTILMKIENDEDGKESVEGEGSESDIHLGAIFWNGFRNLVRSIVESGDMGKLDKLVGVLSHVKVADAGERKVGFAASAAEIALSPSASRPVIAPSKPPVFKTRMLNQLKLDLYRSLEKSPSISLLNVFCQLCEGESNLEFVKLALEDKAADFMTNTRELFETVLETIWRPLKAQFGENNESESTKLSLARLLRNLTLDFRQQIPIVTLDAVVESVNDPLFYQAIMEGASNVFDDTKEEYGMQLATWRCSPKIYGYVMEALKVALSEEANGNESDMQTFANYLVGLPELNLKEGRQMIQSLHEGLKRIWSKPKLNLDEVKKESYLLDFASSFFRLHWNWAKHEQGQDSRELHLLIWANCVEERITRWKSMQKSANYDLLLRANEAALINAKDPKHISAQLEHFSAMGEIARDRLFSLESSVLIRNQGDIVNIITDVANLVDETVFNSTDQTQGKPPILSKTVAFLQSIFSGPCSDAQMFLAKHLWLPQAIIFNAVLIDDQLGTSLGGFSTMTVNSATWAANYLMKLSLLAQMIVRLKINLYNLASTNPVGEHILAQLAETSFILNLLSAAPPLPKHHQQHQLQQHHHSNPQRREEESSSESLVSHLKKVFTEVLEHLRPKSDDKMSDEWSSANEIVGLAMEKIRSTVVHDSYDPILSRYERTCHLSFVSFLKGRDYKKNFMVVYPFVQDTKAISDAIKEPSFELCLMNSKSANLTLLQSFSDKLKVDPSAGGEFERVRSLLFAIHHLAAEMTPWSQSSPEKCLVMSDFLNSAERFVLLLNDVAARKPDIFAEHLLECADLTEVPWPIVQFNVTFMNLIALLLRDRTHLKQLHADTWDFIFCKALGWTQTVSESMSHASQARVSSSGNDDVTLKTLTFTKACCDLVAAISRTFCPKCRFAKKDHEGIKDATWLKLAAFGSAAKPELVDLKAPAKEWDRSFAEPIFSVLLSVFIQFADSTSEYLSSSISSSSSVDASTNFSASGLSRSVGVASAAAGFRSALECCVPDAVFLSEDVEIFAKLLADDFATWKSSSAHFQSLFNRLTSLLVNPLVDIQLLAYHLLSRLLPSVAKAAEEDYSRESAKRETEADASEDLSISSSSSSEEGWRPPSSLFDLLVSAQTAFEYLSADLNVGQTLRIDADDEDYDAYTYVLSYLLCWNAIRRLLECATPELRAQYTIAMREEIPTVLRHLLFLLPDCLIDSAGVSSTPAHPTWQIVFVSTLPLGAILKARHKEDFGFLLGNQDPVLQPRVNTDKSEAVHIGANYYLSGYGRCGFERYCGGGGVAGDLSVSPASHDLVWSAGDSLRSLHGLAGGTFIGTFRDLPASVRQWWTDADKKTTALVERISSLHISPVLTTRELHSVDLDQAKNKSNSALENITVKVLPQSREVVATYMMDEITLELLIKVPANFPLGQIVVECGRRVGELKEQKRWMMQLTTFLRHQNGSIVDGIAMWKKNIDKPFEGVDPCMVCFSVLHSSNYQLPKLTCKACKKKFHSVCLYKWFSTSNNSSCPLCRSLF